MTGLALTIGCFRYDTTRALLDDSVIIDGTNVTMERMP